MTKQLLQTVMTRPAVRPIMIAPRGIFPYHTSHCEPSYPYEILQRLPMRYFIPFVFLAVLIGFHCTQPDPGAQMNTVAEAYVKLVLDVGQHDADYVDAYYGPKEW